MNGRLFFFWKSKKNHMMLNSRMYPVTIATMLLCAAFIPLQQNKYYALFIAKISEGVNWSEKSADLEIGVLGSPDVLASLQSICANKAHINVRAVNSSLSNIDGLQVLFVASSADRSMSKLIEHTSNQQLLIISESKKWTGQGSDVGFFIKGGRLNFLIAEDSLRKKGLKLTTKLMALGQTI